MSIRPGGPQKSWAASARSRAATAAGSIRTLMTHLTPSSGVRTSVGPGTFVTQIYPRPYLYD